MLAADVTAVTQLISPAALAWLVTETQRESRTTVKIDVDPVSMM